MSEDEDEDDETWEVERILMSRVKGRTTEYLTRWKGWSSKYDSWEPLSHFKSAAARELVEEFEEEYQGLEEEEEEEEAADSASGSEMATAAAGGVVGGKRGREEDADDEEDEISEDSSEDVDPDELDEDEWVVQELKSHFFNSTKQLMFKVKWAGWRNATAQPLIDVLHCTKMLDDYAQRFPTVKKHIDAARKCAN